MKKLFLFLAMASTTMFVSCGSDDSEATPPVVVPPVATAITVTASATAVEVGVPVTFTVKNNLTPAVDVTSTSTFTANGVAFNGPTFTPTAANVGTVTIVAKNGTLPTASVVITVTAPVVPSTNKFTYNGTEYTLDNARITAHVNEQQQFIGVNIAPEGQPEEIVTLWRIQAYDGAEGSIETAPHYYQFLFGMPVDGTSVLYPGEAAAIPLGVYAEFQLQQLPFLELTTASVTIASFIEGATENDPYTIESSSSFGDGTSTLSHQFDGDLEGFYAGNLMPPPAESKVGNVRTTSGQFVKLKDAKRTFAKSNKVQRVSLKK